MEDSVTKPVNWEDLARRAGTVFKPNTPVTERDLFAGRTDRIRRLVDVANQDGQHAIIHGERGVGKTSLANVVTKFYSPELPVVSPRINCDSLDDFGTVWRKVFEEIELKRPEPVVGFGGGIQGTLFTSPTPVLADPTPDGVRRALTVLARTCLPLIVVDEFDRLKEESRRPFADMIKNLSDHAVRATIVLVGVGDSVDDLIAGHQSVARNLIQIQMPRMSGAEIREVINKGLEVLGMTIEDKALDRIDLLSQGLPHYPHALGLHASRQALDAHSLHISCEVLDQAIGKAIEDTHQSIVSAYAGAVRSARKDNLFGDVLLACALAKTDDLGYFAAQDVRPPLSELLKKPYGISSFAQHLGEFSDEKRGNVLVRIGSRRYRYRFADPLMQPYVIMQGVHAGRVRDNHLRSRTAGIFQHPSLLTRGAFEGSQEREA